MHASHQPDSCPNAEFWLAGEEEERWLQRSCNRRMSQWHGKVLPRQHILLTHRAGAQHLTLALVSLLPKHAPVQNKI